jgi:hypothetical protein
MTLKPMVFCSRRLYRENSNPPKSPFAKGGLLNPPLEKGGRGDFHRWRGANIYHSRLDGDCPDETPGALLIPMSNQKTIFVILSAAKNLPF